MLSGLPSGVSVKAVAVLVSTVPAGTSLSTVPVSVMVTFELFVRPVLRRLQGHSRLFRHPVPVVLDEPVSIGARLTHFLRGIARPAEDGRMHARLTGPQGSGILTSMARANALLVVPEDRPRCEAGEVVNAVLVGDDASLAESFAL